METDAESVTEELLRKKEDEKKDESDNYLYVVMFYFLGAACFIPNNFYVTANKYWMYKFRDPTLPFNETAEKTSLQKNFTAYVTIAGNVGMVTALVITFILGKKISLQKKIVGSMTSMLVLFVITSLFIYVDTDSWQKGFYVIALGICGILGACSFVLLVSLFQLSSRFPPRCLAAQLAGQSVCGVLAAVIQIIALLVPSVTGTAALYYSIATVAIGAVALAFILFVKKSEDFQSKFEEPKDEDPSAKSKPNLAMILRVLKKLPLLIIAFILCVGSTFILNPGLTTLIESSGKGTSVWSDTYFIPVCVFLLFNSFDFIGREVSNHFTKLTNKYAIFIASIIRLPLFPLILLCNLQPRSHLPVLFHNDAFFIIFMILLAFSGGYLMNIVIIVLSDLCEPEEKMIGMFVIMTVMILLVPVFSVLSSVIINVI